MGRPREAPAPVHSVGSLGRRRAVGGNDCLREKEWVGGYRDPRGGVRWDSTGGTGGTGGTGVDGIPGWGVNGIREAGRGQWSLGEGEVARVVGEGAVDAGVGTWGCYALDCCCGGGRCQSFAIHKTWGRWQLGPFMQSEIYF